MKHKIMISLRDSQGGSSLIEILIGSFLSLLVTAVLLSFMLAELQQNDYQTNLFSLQRQFIRLSQLLYHEIAMAGYQGCHIASRQTALQITSVAEMPTTWVGKNEIVKSDTMVIHIEKLATWHDYLRVTHYTQDKQWFISNHQKLKIGDTVMIADCQKNTIATVESVSQQTDQQLVTTTPVTVSFAAGSYFGLWQRETFYIAATDRTTAQGTPIWGLYSYEDNSRYEWAEGVNDLQAAMTVDEHQHAVLNVYLLLASLRRMTARPQRYFFMNTWHEAHDGHFYQPFEVDIPLQGVS